MIKKYGSELNIPPSQLHQHVLRHLYGTELAEDDVISETRQALMGHEDPKSQQEYVHLATKKLRKAVDKANPLGKMDTPVTGLLKQLKS